MEEESCHHATPAGESHKPRNEIHEKCVVDCFQKTEATGLPYLLSQCIQKEGHEDRIFSSLKI
jgi:hypothetical protein